MTVFNEDKPIPISKSLGDTVDLQGVRIQLPKKPKLSEVYKCSEKKLEQVWRIQQPPKELKRNTIDEHFEFLERELLRIQDGFWFMNNGEATYITGLHYYYINYVKIDVGHPEYRDRDRLFFYFWEAANKNPQCAGVTLVKPRRMGATWIGSGMLLYYGSQIRDALLGILSKTGADAKSMFKKKVVSVFRKLPFWLQPTSASGTAPSTSLEFAEPAKRSKETAAGIEESEALNTIIEWKNTTENSFDSEKLIMLVFDESGKIDKEISLETLWEVLSKTLYVGLRIVGKAFLPSTVNDLDAGGEQFKMLYMASRISEMIEGATPTGLWAYFVPAYDGLEGFIDIYGKSVTEDPEKPVMGIHGDYIIEGSKTALKRARERRKKISKKTYLENVRQYPWTIEEAFYFNSSTAVLDTEKIAQQIAYEENDRLHSPVVTGNFIWGEQDKEVVWIPNENGKFKIKWLPPVDMRNKYFIKNGKKRPANGMYGAGGLDPYVHDRTKDGRGSDGGIHFHTKKVSGGREEVPYYECIVEYITKAETARDFFEDALMCSFFYGMPILFENNKYDLYRHFDARGYSEYLMDNPKEFEKKGSRASTSKSKIKGQHSNTDTNNTHAGFLQSYVYEYIGEDEETGEIGDFPFLKTLRQLAQFSVEERGSLDGAVSLGLALMAVSDREYNLNEQREKTHPLIRKGKIRISY